MTEAGLPYLEAVIAFTVAISGLHLYLDTRQLKASVISCRSK